ncbi:PQQ-like beta-propeller repeat protein [Rubripirellula sp.]|nr:PQQ-binding-like beta-propeller repeat protein [Rubripirellula sp.]MDB4624648.1 PQQ-like beta-propeller repeat protein [Rubripirellula sp.]
MSKNQHTTLVKCLTFALGFTCCCEWSHAGNWGHWRGDGGNSVSKDASPPTTWGPTKNIKWKAVVPGRGSGSPVVWDDRVFVVSAIPTASAAYEYAVICFDRNNGQQKWNKVAATGKPHEGTHSTNGFASASPCTDGERVYAHFGSRGLYCYTIDGELLWSRTDLPPDSRGDAISGVSRFTVHSTASPDSMSPRPVARKAPRNDPRNPLPT